MWFCTFRSILESHSTIWSMRIQFISYYSHRSVCVWSYDSSESSYHLLLRYHRPLPMISHTNNSTFFYSVLISTPFCFLSSQPFFYYVSTNVNKFYEIYNKKKIKQKLAILPVILCCFFCLVISVQFPEFPLFYFRNSKRNSFPVTKFDLKSKQKQHTHN